MHEGSFEQGMRGLVDLDALLREHGLAPDFWPQLVARASALQLIRPLFYALRYVGMMLGTVVPQDVLAELDQAPGARPGRVAPEVDGRDVHAGVVPAAPFGGRPVDPLARGFLYLRGHWLRMPPGLLTLHLFESCGSRPPKELECRSARMDPLGAADAAVYAGGVERFSDSATQHSA